MRKSCCALQQKCVATLDVTTVTRDKNTVPDLYSAGVLSIRKSVLSSKETLCKKIRLLNSQYIHL